MKELFKKCPKCTGGLESIRVTLPEGGTEVVTDTCRTCNGTSEVPNDSYLSEDFIDKINDISDRMDDIMERCNDIFEKVNE